MHIRTCILPQTTAHTCIPHHTRTHAHRAYWAIGGELRTEREYAHAQFLEAAAGDGSAEGGAGGEGAWGGLAFEWLGHWYEQVRYLHTSLMGLRMGVQEEGDHG